MKKFSKVFMLLLLIPLALGLCACGGKSDHLITVNICSIFNNHTKTTYYCGDNFSASQTYVALKYYEKEVNTEWTLQSSLADLHKKGFVYEVTGFDSSVAVDSQTISINITSEKYEGEVAVHFNVQIMPAYVTGIEVVDAETFIKDVYVVGETLPIADMQIKKTYNDGHTDNVALEENMISGFDTSEVRSSSRKMTITCDEQSVSFNYTVAPAENYDLFSEAYLKCFIPNEELGYEKTTDTMFNDAQKWKKEGVASVEIGCYQAMAEQTETSIINRYNTSGSIARPNVTILSLEKTTINGVEATVAKFKIGIIATVYTDIYITRNVTFSNGLTSVTGSRTIKILFENYAGSAEASEMIANVMGSIK